jgi:hypothetical protein
MNDQESYAYDVFISYSSKDRTWVRKELLARLEEAGLEVIIDYRDFEIGAPIVTEMQRAVVSSRKTLLVLTPAYLDSAWAEFENLMLQTLDPGARKRRLLPLFKEPCDLPPRIQMLGYADFTDPDPEALDLAWTRLLAALSAPAKAPPPSAPQPAASAGASQGHDLVQLRNMLVERCDPGDLRNLCFSMGIDSDNYPSAKRDFIIKLLSDLRRWDRVDEFVQVLRADAPWVLRE